MIPRVDLDFDPVKVEFADLSTEFVAAPPLMMYVLDVPNDEFTFFIVQSNPAASATLTVNPSRSTVVTPQGVAATEPLSIYLDKDDGDLYCFRIPPQTYNNNGGTVRFLFPMVGDPPVGGMFVGRFPRNHSHYGSVLIPSEGELSIGTPVTQLPQWVSFMSVTGGGSFIARKGQNAIWLFQNSSEDDSMVLVQTSESALKSVGFGPRFGRMYNRALGEETGPLFCIHPVIIPADGEIYCCVRPVAAYDGNNFMFNLNKSEGTVFIQSEQDVAVARLDLRI